MNDTQAFDAMLKRYVERIVRDNAKRDNATDCRQNHKLRQFLVSLRLIEDQLQAYLSPVEHRAFGYAIAQVTDAIRGRT